MAERRMCAVGALGCLDTLVNGGLANKSFDILRGLQERVGGLLVDAINLQALLSWQAQSGERVATLTIPVLAVLAGCRGYLGVRLGHARGALCTGYRSFSGL